MKLAEIHNIQAEYFAYDGCHKIYIIETEQDMRASRQASYEILPIQQLDKIFEDSCPLKFIKNWSLTKTIVPQKD